MSPASLADVLREARQAERRSFRRVLDADGVCRTFHVGWQTGSTTHVAEIRVPEVTPDFVAFALDQEGHAYQCLALEEQALALYPVIDPISVEHAMNVEQVLLPAVLELFRRTPSADGFRGFGRFWAAVRAAWKGQGDPADEDLPESLGRVLEAVKSEVSELTSEDVLRERAFVRFYQHVLCDGEEYRRKVRESLEIVVSRVNERFETERKAMVRALQESGFDEEDVRHRDR